MYHVYQFGGNASVTLSLLSIDPKRNVKCYNWYFINGHVFHIKKYGQGKRHNSRLCVKGLTSNKFEVDYYDKLEEVSELQYYSEHDKVFLFK